MYLNVRCTRCRHVVTVHWAQRQVCRVGMPFPLVATTQQGAVPFCPFSVTVAHSLTPSGTTRQDGNYGNLKFRFLGHVKDPSRRRGDPYFSRPNCTSPPSNDLERLASTPLHDEARSRLSKTRQKWIQS